MSATAAAPLEVGVAGAPAALDRWIVGQQGPRPSKAEAIRQIFASHLPRSTGALVDLIPALQASIDIVGKLRELNKKVGEAEFKTGCR